MTQNNFYCFNPYFEDDHKQNAFRFTGTKFHNFSNQSVKLQKLMKRNLAVQDSQQFIEKFKNLALSVQFVNTNKNQDKKAKNIKKFGYSTIIPKISNRFTSQKKQFKTVITNNNKNKSHNDYTKSQFSETIPIKNFRNTFGKLNGTILTKYKSPRVGIVRYLYKKVQSPELIQKYQKSKQPSDNAIVTQIPKSMIKHDRFYSLLTGQKKDLAQKESRSHRYESNNLSIVKKNKSKNQYKFTFDQHNLNQSNNPQENYFMKWTQKNYQHFNIKHQQFCPWKHYDDQKTIQNDKYY